MRSGFFSITHVLLFIVAAALVAGCAPAGDAPEKMVTEADALDKAWLEAYNSKNVDAIMALYWNSPDLVSYPPGEMEVRGWDKMKEGMMKEFSQATDGKLEFVETSNRAMGTVVIGSGKWRFTMPSAQVDVTGRYTDVKAKKEGKWVYLMDHASVPMPPPPDQPSGN
ncbi:MAG: nuclear transport factor 2 family protein [Bacteroidetes bacterium]|nr:nuclear transport factor 2 family protein [Bacteroidota bacterium]MCW5894659.1 nuclear transport factor 2 family protein [Bacteroidota bacterium]